MENLKNESTNGNERDQPNETQNKSYHEFPKLRVITKLQRIEEPSDRLEIFNGFSKKFLPTLPRNFKTLVGTPIRIESENPQEVIELLGHFLEIDDYKTNMVTFWFLDTLALQVLRHKNDLDDHYVSVLISWLAGEMKLIQDKKLSREDFVGEMKEIFHTAADKVSQTNQLSHWDEIVRRDITEEAVAENMEAESIEQTLLDDQRSSILKESKRRGSRKSLQRRQSNESKTGVIKKDSNSEDTKIDVLPVLEKNPQSSSSIDPLAVLDIVIESTYDMYANELRYALVYAVFVEPLEIETYNLPFLLRTPRPVKVADFKKEPFDTRLQRRLRKDGAPEEKNKRVTKAKDKGKTKSKAAILKVPTTPPTSLTDEEILMNERRFILPLIEAKEASIVFETNAGDT